MCLIPLLQFVLLPSIKSTIYCTLPLNQRFLEFYYYSLHNGREHQKEGVSSYTRPRFFYSVLLPFLTVSWFSFLKFVVLQFRRWVSLSWTLFSGTEKMPRWFAERITPVYVQFRRSKHSFIRFFSLSISSVLYIYLSYFLTTILRLRFSSTSSVFYWILPTKPCLKLWQNFQLVTCRSWRRLPCV